MKNLFDFATKELSQDAFLRWLFENWDCDKQIEIIVKKLLKKFCELKDNEEIEKITSATQDHNIDIRIDVKTKVNRTFSLFIEDKVFSSEHSSQLEIYDEYINGLKGETYKLFYKTNLLSDTDDKGIKEANDKNTHGKQWETIDINEIAEIFGGGQHYENIILQDYAEHINKIAQAVNNTEIPSSHSDGIDFLKWEAYFKNTIKKNLKEDGYHADAWKAGQYPYICLVIKKEGLADKIPYLEIRSKDCLNNCFRALILCYGVGDKNLESQQEKLIDNIDKLIISGQTKFKTGRRIYRQKRKRIYPKQVACTDVIKNVSDDKSFIDLVEELAGDYLKIMEDWH